MMQFRFRLSMLLRLRENLRDECRQQLAAAQWAEEIVVARMIELDTEMQGLRRQTHAASRPGPVDIDRLLNAGRYDMTLRAERQVAQDQRQKVVAEIQRRREALVEADRDVKILEKLREKQSARHRYEENIRDVKQLDAVALRMATTKT